MNARAARLSVFPQRCDECGRCVEACPRGGIRVAAGHVLIDARGCVGCLACVRSCGRNAIAQASIGEGAPGTPANVVVSSRSEAKALRKQAELKTRETKAWYRSVTPREATRPESGSQPQLGFTWTLGEAGLLCLALLVAIAAKNEALGLPALALMPEAGRVAAGAGILLLFYAAQVAALAVLVRRREAGFGSAFRLKTGFDAGSAAGSAGLVLVLALGTRIASLLWGVAATAAGWPPPASEGTSLSAVFGSGLPGLILAVSLAVFVGPITEELAFRGVIAAALNDRFGTRIAILGSAVLFALYHATAWLLVPMFIFGCALAWLALTRRTLWPAIVLHGLYNGVVVAASFWLAR